MATKRPAPDPSPGISIATSFYDVGGLMKMQSRTIETMVEANRIFVETAQAIVNCQANMMRDCVEQMTHAFSALSGRGDPAEIASREGAAAQALIEKTAAHVRDIAELMRKSNAAAMQLVNGSMRPLLDEAAGPQSRKRAAIE